MGPDPKLVSMVIKSALAASLVLTVLCLLLTGAASPAAGAASTTLDVPAEEPLVEAESAGDEEGCPLSSAYPEKIRQWCDLIVEFASAHELPAELIAAVILQESGGNSMAYSSSGAVGLMQVMPRDGLAAQFQCVNGPCFASRPTIAELQDPAYNIEYGTRMLAGLLGRTGELREALKAYGPMDVGYRYADIILSIYDNYR
jgi:soluble lytic murein transglycosylase-like protein